MVRGQEAKRPQNNEIRIGFDTQYMGYFPDPAQDDLVVNSDGNAITIPAGTYTTSGNTITIASNPTPQGGRWRLIQEYERPEPIMTWQYDNNNLMDQEVRITSRYVWEPEMILNQYPPLTVPVDDVDNNE